MVAAKKPASVSEYLAGLEPERKRAISAVRQLIQQRLPEGYEEAWQYGMISYVVPLTTYPAGYLGKKDVPLPYLSLASQKSYMAIYLMGLCGDPKLSSSFAVTWKKSGKKLDMGKSCLRFKSVDDLAFDVLGDAIAILPVATYVELYESNRGSGKKPSKR